MLSFSISPQLKACTADFKMGIVIYHHIVISTMPQIISGRLPLFYQNIRLSLEEQAVADIPGVKEWRSVFKKAGTDPSRYRPSQEALFRRLKKYGSLPAVHSAVDLNNFFSLQYGIPLGIYDRKQIEEPVTVTIGTKTDCYDALNSRTMSMENKIVAVDRRGAFGSPIVDSVRTKVTEDTTDALQMVYVRPSMPKEKADRLVQKIAEMFVQVHGGTAEHAVICE